MSTRSERPDPIRAARLKARAPLPKRFYRAAGHAPAAGGRLMQFDGKPARTPARAALIVPGERLADALAAEWNAQGEFIDPAGMPLTRIVNTAIDGVAARMAEVRADIVAHAGSDLICYRAETPAALAERQEAAWSPLIEWARTELDAPLTVGRGIAHVPQDAAAFAAIDAALAPYDALRLAALHAITTLTGSAVLALAAARHRLTAAEAWTAAHIDEDWQIEHWGADREASARRNARWREMEAAAFILAE